MLSVWGVLSVLESASRGSSWDIGVFALPVAFLLFLATRVGHNLAVGLTVYWLIGSILLILELFPIQNFIHVTSHEHHLSTLSLTAKRTLVWPFAIFQLWQFRTLCGDGFRSYCGREPMT